jgi:formate/nitrite transporter FocA (FNT family)
VKPASRNHVGQVDSEALEETEEETTQQAKQRSSPSGKVVYHAILKEADEELGRSTGALFWSGLAAGLSMGFSLIAEGLLRHHLPDQGWRPLVAKLGYCVGFLIVILGRQQLFTENTLTPMLPLMTRKDLATFMNVMRLWGVVLLANLIGALAIGWVTTHAPAFEPDQRATFVALGHEAMRFGFFATLVRGIFAGWLIALLVWMLPAADAARVWVIVIITYLVGLGGFSHIIAGACEVFALASAGGKPWLTVIGGYIVPVLIGNIIGGVLLVAALNHAQVVGAEEG